MEERGDMIAAYHKRFQGDNKEVLYEKFSDNNNFY